MSTLHIPCTPSNYACLPRYWNMMMTALRLQHPMLQRPPLDCTGRTLCQFFSRKSLRVLLTIFITAMLSPTPVLHRSLLWRDQTWSINGRPHALSGWHKQTAIKLCQHICVTSTLRASVCPYRPHHTNIIHHIALWNTSTNRSWVATTSPNYLLGAATSGSLEETAILPGENTQVEFPLGTRFTLVFKY
jgi:hypothetical protein